MRLRSLLFFVSFALTIAGCQKASSPEKIVDGLSAKMSDEKILQVLHLDRTKLHSKEAVGADGSSMIYTDAVHEVWITRSVVSGVIVMRMEPASERKTWELGLP